MHTSRFNFLGYIRVLSIYFRGLSRCLNLPMGVLGFKPSPCLVYSFLRQEFQHQYRGLMSGGHPSQNLCQDFHVAFCSILHRPSHFDGQRSRL